MRMEGLGVVGGAARNARSGGASLSTVVLLYLEGKIMADTVIADGWRMQSTRRHDDMMYSVL